MKPVPPDRLRDVVDAVLEALDEGLDGPALVARAMLSPFHKLSAPGPERLRWLAGRGLSPRFGPAERIRSLAGLSARIAACLSLLRDSHRRMRARPRCGGECDPSVRAEGYPERDGSRGLVASTTRAFSLLVRRGDRDR